jgi:hypothetical protein
MGDLTLLLSGVAGSFVGWIGREVVDWFKTKAAHRRELEARLHDHRLATAEAAIPNLVQSISALVGFLNAWKSQFEGKLRPELTASMIASMQKRLDDLTAESYRAVLLIQFHFGEEVEQTLAQTDSDAMQLVQLMSEFISNAEFMDGLLEGVNVDAARANQPDSDLIRLVDGNKEWQREQIAKMLHLAERRQKAVSEAAKQMRHALQPH